MGVECDKFELLSSSEAIMTRNQTRTIARIHDADEARRFEAQQATREGAALRGELGLASQLLAMSERYRELRAAGRVTEARAIKEAAMKMLDAAEERAA